MNVNIYKTYLDKAYEAYSKINTLTDLEKLKEYNPKYNVDIIKINFKVRNSNQKQNKKENYTLESKNSINSYESQK